MKCGGKFSWVARKPEAGIRESAKLGSGIREAEIREAGVKIREAGKSAKLGSGLRFCDSQSSMPLP